MSVWAELIKKIRTECPIFGNRVIGATEFDALRGNDGDYTTSLEAPFVVIADAPRQFQPIQGNTFEQTVDYRFSTMVAVQYLERTKSVETTTNKESVISNGVSLLSTDYQEFVSSLNVKNVDESITYTYGKDYSFDPYTNKLIKLDGGLISPSAKTQNLTFTTSIITLPAGITSVTSVKNQAGTVTYSSPADYTVSGNLITRVNGGAIAPGATVKITYVGTFVKTSYVSRKGGLALMDLRERCYRYLYDCLIGYEVKSLPRSKRIYATDTYHLLFTDQMLYGQINWLIPTIVSSKVNFYAPPNDYPIREFFTHTENTPVRFDDSGFTTLDYTNVNEDCHG